MKSVNVAAEAETSLDVASQRAYNHIRDQIFAGTLRPGERVTEEKTAQELGMSRTPVREAIRLLQSEGFLVGAAHRGAAVPEFTPDDVRDTYALRAILEGHVAGLAAERATPGEIAEMRQAIERLDAVVETGLGARGRRPDSALTAEIRARSDDLRRLIIAASRSTRAASLLQGLIDLPLVYRAFSWYTREQAERSADARRRIVDAIERRDVRRAEILMTDYVLQARDAVLAGIESPSSGTSAAPAKGVG
jgi:DNA-binding GntR family transcriptional regulator